ncbi:MAG: hypothetical protein AB7G08_28305 [Hyphomicrobiaceae bacterium]
MQSQNDQTILAKLIELCAFLGVHPLPRETVREYGARILGGTDCEDEDLDDVRFRFAALLDLEAS